MAARAFEFAILTAARTGEVLGAEWSEIDFDAKLWTVPADRMKGEPLSESSGATVSERIEQDMHQLEQSLILSGLPPAGSTG